MMDLCQVYLSNEDALGIEAERWMVMENVIHNHPRSTSILSLKSEFMQHLVGRASGMYYSSNTKCTSNVDPNETD